MQTSVSEQQSSLLWRAPALGTHPERPQIPSVQTPRQHSAEVEQRDPSGTHVGGSQSGPTQPHGGGGQGAGVTGIVLSPSLLGDAWT